MFQRSGSMRDFTCLFHLDVSGPVSYLSWYKLFLVPKNDIALSEECSLLSRKRAPAFVSTKIATDMAPLNEGEFFCEYSKYGNRATVEDNDCLAPGGLLHDCRMLRHLACKTVQTPMRCGRISYPLHAKSEHCFPTLWVGPKETEGGRKHACPNQEVGREGGGKGFNLPFRHTPLHSPHTSGDKRRGVNHILYSSSSRVEKKSFLESPLTQQ